MSDRDDIMRPWRKPRLRRAILFLLIAAVGMALALIAWRFAQDQPVDYADIEEHFKYGSTGGERAAGIPYWIWRSLPRVCADHLPEDRPSPAGQEYGAFGFLYEAD